jgi:hypothetical protein
VESKRGKIHGMKHWRITLGDLRSNAVGVDSDCAEPELHND